MIHPSSILIILSILSFIVRCTALTFEDLPETEPPLSHSLWDYHDQLIEIRGFFYSIDDSKGILASQPDLKSCCVAAPSKISQQLFLQGDLVNLPHQRAVTVKGIFKIHPVYENNGDLKQLYFLENTSKVSVNRFPMGYALLFLLTTGIIWFLWKKT